MEFTVDRPPGKSPLEDLSECAIAAELAAELERFRAIAACSTVAEERLTRPAAGGVRGGAMATVRLFPGSAHPIAISLPAACVAIGPYAGVPRLPIRAANQP